VELVGQPDDAEDIVQETFVRIWRHRAEWKPSGTVGAYLYRITRNLALNVVRNRRIRQRLAEVRGEELFRVATPPTADEVFEAELLQEELEAAIASLPERRREIFVLCRYHRLSHREIAQTLGISIQTVANQMRSALADLRRALIHHFEGE
jgi:RNA polymerase sigma-70 factor, ECF subfamily